MQDNVLTTKYRPRRFSEIIGQSGIEIVRSYIGSRRAVPGLWIFHGMKGTGKTSTARVFAMALNCLNLEEGKNPCGKCDNCKDTLDGAEDVIKELDSASHRGIDEIRNLKRVVAFKSRGYRVVILDEAHSLTSYANEALLKITEEPPRGVIFILSTTKLESIIPTIKDRAIIVRFEKVKDVFLNKHLHYIAELEGVKEKLNSDVIDTLIRESDGSVRSLVKGLDIFISLLNDGKENDFCKIFSSFRDEEERVIINLIKSYFEKRIGIFYESVDLLKDYGYTPVEIFMNLYSGILTIGLRPLGLTKFRYSDELVGVDITKDNIKWFLNKAPDWIRLLKEFPDYEFLKKFLLEFLLI